MRMISGREINDFHWTRKNCFDGQFIVSLALEYATDEVQLDIQERRKFLDVCKSMVKAELLCEKDLEFIHYCLMRTQA